MRSQPQEIEDEEHEQVIDRVAAIDVAKASGMVCVRVPHESKPGRRVSRVWEVPATTRAVTELADYLVCQGVGKVTVESTSVIRGHQSASATAGDSPVCPFLPPPRTRYLRDLLRRRQPTAVRTSRQPLVVAAFVLAVADAHATARPGQCPISSYLRPG